MHFDANSVFLDSVQRDRLLIRLGGLPLAIAQAGAFLKESQLKLEDYIDCYDRKFERLVNDGPEEQLLAYHGSIWTTWVISFDEIRGQNDAGMAAANLLILWSCLDNKDLWYELFSGATLEEHKETFPSWMTKHIARDQLDFSKAMTLLHRYSMIEETNCLGSYSLHPVVHKWAYHYFHDEICQTIGPTAVMLVKNSSMGYLSFNDKASLSCNAVEPLYRLIPHVKSVFEKISSLTDNSRLRLEHRREFACILDLFAHVCLIHRGFFTACSSVTLIDIDRYRRQDTLEGATKPREWAHQCHFHMTRRDSNGPTLIIYMVC